MFKFMAPMLGLLVTTACGITPASDGSLSSQKNFLGEDIAQTGEVRVGRTAFEQAQKEGWSSQELSVEGPIESNKSGAATGHYIIRL